MTILGLLIIMLKYVVIEMSEQSGRHPKQPEPQRKSLARIWKKPKSQLFPQNGMTISRATNCRCLSRKLQHIDGFKAHGHAGQSHIFLAHTIEEAPPLPLHVVRVVMVMVDAAAVLFIQWSMYEEPTYADPDAVDDTTKMFNSAAGQLTKFVAQCRWNTTTSGCSTS